MTKGTSHPIWSALAALVHRSRFIGAVTAGVAILSIVITLLLPNVYQADARLLLPTGGSGGSFAAALIRNLPGGASAFLGGGAAGDYARYLSILTSRTMLDAVIEEFDLINVYELERNRAPQESAREALLKNSTFAVDERLEYLSVRVIDENSNRAANIANFMVDRLNEVNSELSVQSAGHLRTYAETRYNQALASLDSVLTELQTFHQTYGVIDLPSQARAYYEQLAVLRAEVLKAEVAYESSREQFGDQNPSVRGQLSVLRAAERKYAEALAGSEVVLPVAQERMPALAREYAELELTRTIQSRILESIAPILEQAYFEEGHEVQAVQVVDRAIAPVKKHGPRRTFIVLGATLSAFLLSWLFVLIMGWWNRNHRRIQDELRLSPRTKEHEELLS